MTFKPHDLGAKSYVGTSLIGYLNSVVMFLLLYYRNKDFKSNFKNLCQDETDVENSTENVVDKQCNSTDEEKPCQINVFM